MDTQSFKNLVEGIGALLPGIALLAGGLLFLWKREWRPRLQLSVGIESFTKTQDAYLIEPVCIVENKGWLRCYIYRLEFSVRYLLRDDQLEAGDERLLGQTIFPHPAVRVDFVKPEWVWSYVEAGIRLRYSHVTHIPAEAVAVLVWAKLYHKKENDTDFFSVQKVLSIVEEKLV